MTRTEWLTELLRRTKLTILTISIAHGLVGLALLKGGSPYHHALLSDLTGPVFLLSAYSSIRVYFRPDNTVLARRAGVIGCLAHLGRCMSVIVYGASYGGLFTWSTLLNVGIHAMIARVIFDLWLTRIVPLSKTLLGPDTFET